VRFNAGDEPDVLAEHYEPEGFAMPMTMRVVDQQNEAGAYHDRRCRQELALNGAARPPTKPAGCSKAASKSPARSGAWSCGDRAGMIPAEPYLDQVPRPK